MAMKTFAAGKHLRLVCRPEGMEASTPVEMEKALNVGVVPLLKN